MYLFIFNLLYPTEGQKPIFILFIPSDLEKVYTNLVDTRQARLAVIFWVFRDTA